LINRIHARWPINLKPRLRRVFQRRGATQPEVALEARNLLEEKIDAASLDENTLRPRNP